MYRFSPCAGLCDATELVALSTFSSCAASRRSMVAKDADVDELWVRWAPSMSRVAYRSQHEKPGVSPFVVPFLLFLFPDGSLARMHV